MKVYVRTCITRDNGRSRIDFRQKAVTELVTGDFTLRLKPNVPEMNISETVYIYK